MEADTPKIPKVNRRKFLAVSGGLTFAVSVGSAGYVFSRSQQRETLPFNAWVQVKPDDTIVIYNPAAEMGQGSMTALPVILAEEMDADWSKVKIEYSPIDRPTYGHDIWGIGPLMAIVGSVAVRGYFERLRIAGAQARQILMTNAAEKWGVSVSEVSTEPSVVIHKASNRRMSYGEIAAFATVPETMPEIPLEELKDPKDFRLIGTIMPRRDVPEKVVGKATYSLDVHLPDMVYAAIQHAPYHASRPTLMNEADVLKTTGVMKVVTLEHGVGVIAKDIETAFKAAKALRIDWSQVEPAATYNSQESLQGYPEMIDDDGIEAAEVFSSGDVTNVKGVERTYEASYLNDYAYHAQMEPLNAVVSVAKDKKSAEIWVGTQAPDSALRDASRTLGIDQSKINLQPCYLGGGFGRRASRDYLVEACHLAKTVDVPVKLIWSREDDVKFGRFRPATLQKIKAGVNSSSEIISWDYITMGPGGALISTGSQLPFYSIPNQKIVAKPLDHGIRTRSWRAEGHGANKFAIEAFIDEIASNEGIDQVEFRRKLLKDSQRGLEVLNTVANMTNWGSTVPEGRARGLSFCERDSTTACICEISLNRSSGKINVHKVWMAVDSGTVVQPDNALAQIEGAITMGISSSLTERVTIKNGAVEQSNFHNYQLLRCQDAPESIEVKFVPSTERPEGIGEAGLPALGGAIANAFATLTGKRLYEMPFTRDRVKKALES